MLNWSLVFLILSVIMGIFGFGGISTASVGVAQNLFYISLLLFSISLVSGLYTEMSEANKPTLN
jgi:uncharacterized membrane protein YtjA (UPF0391 family)